MSDDPKKEPAYGRRVQPIPDRVTPVPPLPAVMAMPGAAQAEGTRTEGLTYAVGLQPVPNSTVPGLPAGVTVSHVFGPGQTPCDPIAAGLDVNYKPLSTAEDRLITQTGTIGSGPRPFSANVPAPTSDHSTVPAPRDVIVATSPGPNSVTAPA